MKQRLAMEAVRVGTVVALLGTGVLACGGNPRDYKTCEPIPDASLAKLPSHLMETGLFQSTSPEVLGDGVQPYEPQFELWSDGAKKRRWIKLPAGSHIDSQDMDAWQFPEGTKLWKEFSRDGTRVETRLLQKTGPNPQDWVPLAYIWNDANTDADAAPKGQQNAHGTQHDVPDATTCMGCHGGTASRVLGFSAVQLAYDALPGLLDLDALVQQGSLSKPPAAPITIPGNAVERAALGYLHANCSHCHNLQRPTSAGNAVGPFTVTPPPLLVPRCFDPEQDFDFQLRAPDLGSVGDTATYKTAIKGKLIQKGNPDSSRVFTNMESGTMPALGTEVVNPAGVEILKAWITQL